MQRRWGSREFKLYKKKKNPLIAFPATFWMSCFPLEVSLRLILEEAAGIVGKLTILAAAWTEHTPQIIFRNIFHALVALCMGISWHEGLP